MKFQFRLQKVLDLRKHEEENIKNQLAILAKELQIEKRNLYNLQLEQNKILSEINLLTGKTIDINELLWKRNYILKLDNEIMLQKKIIIQLENEHKNMIAKYIEITKKVKVLEKLKEKLYKKFIKELEREEQNFLDEIGTNQFIRNKIALQKSQ
ncbi:MAG TPA: flagellar export protein FliJ [bacterium]|nr:flagellar export protein FliJ [bacterium]HOL47458.1 flagellar export protein FliJ [bacterium]HPQ18938.1 flagellar export protein FliJ [bacterium]